MKLKAYLLRNVNEELSIVQKTYDLIKWYVPILNRLPRNHKYSIGDRIISQLYDFLEQLVLARYSKNKLPVIEPLNGRLNLLRYQTRLLFDFQLMESKRYEYVSTKIDEIGSELGNWIKSQQKRALVS